jgi:hypothetical protein
MIMAFSLVLRQPSCFDVIKVSGAVSIISNSRSLCATSRDDNGLFLGALTMIDGTRHKRPADLEALACKEAFTLSTDLLCSRVVIASDCNNVVDDINSNSGGVYATITKEIELSASDIMSCPFIHEGRHSNFS